MKASYNDLVRAYQAWRQDYNPQKVTLKQARDEADCFIEALKSVLRDFDAVTLYGFGTLDAKVVIVPAGERYNPATGKKEKFKKHKTVRAHFRPYKNLKETILNS